MAVTGSKSAIVIGGRRERGGKAIYNGFPAEIEKCRRGVDGVSCLCQDQEDVDGLFASENLTLEADKDCT